MKVLLYLILPALLSSCNLASQAERSSQLIRANQELSMDAIAYDAVTFDDGFDASELNPNSVEASSRSVQDHIATISRNFQAINDHITTVQSEINMRGENGNAIQKNTEVIIKNTEAVENLNKLITQNSFSTLRWLLIISATLFIIPWIILCLYTFFNHGQLLEIKKILKKAKKE